MPRNAVRKRLELKLAEIEAELEQLARKKEVLEQKLKKLKGLAKAMADLPPDLLSLVEGGAPEEDAPVALMTNFFRIAAFLRAERNSPKTIGDIEKGTGIPRTSVSAVIYRTHPERFESHDLPGSRAKAWTLKPQEDDEGPEPDDAPGFCEGAPDEPPDEPPGEPDPLFGEPPSEPDPLFDEPPIDEPSDFDQPPEMPEDFAF